MSKKLIVLTIVIAIVIVLGLVMFALGKDSKQPSISEHHDAAGGHHGNAHDEDDDKVDISKALDETKQAEVSIDITDFAYAKPNLKISKGTTVTWTNRETVKHNVMGVHNGETKAHDAPTAEQVKPGVLASSLLAKGESYSFTFNETATIDYHCAPHPYMKASITVVE